MKNLLLKLEDSFHIYQQFLTLYLLSYSPITLMLNADLMMNTIDKLYNRVRGWWKSLISFIISTETYRELRKKASRMPIVFYPVPLV